MDTLKKDNQRLSCLIQDSNVENRKLTETVASYQESSLDQVISPITDYIGILVNSIRAICKRNKEKRRRSIIKTTRLGRKD